MKTAFVLGRAVLGGFFSKRIEPSQEPKSSRTVRASKNIPYPEQSVIASGLVLTLSGLSLILGAKPRLGAAGLIGFLAIASASMNDFWNSEDPGEKQNNMIHFSKNMAMLGACLALAGTETPWPVSVDACLD